jgi:hypothetical protein
MLRLADTSIRLYRRRDWSVSVRLRSYLMIHCKGEGFHLATYLNRLDLALAFASGENVELDEYGYTDNCIFQLDHMIHGFWASGVCQRESLRDGAARLRVAYRLFSSEGQGKPDEFEIVVPVLARGVRNQRWARQDRSAA